MKIQAKKMGEFLKECLNQGIDMKTLVDFPTVARGAILSYQSGRFTTIADAVAHFVKQCGTTETNRQVALNNSAE